MASVKLIDAKNMAAVDPKVGILLDVRTKPEHAEKHLVIDHVHIPLDNINPDEIIQGRGLDKAAAVHLLCRSGARAAKAAEKFIAAGYTNVYVIDGGIMACEEYGHDLDGYGTAKGAAAGGRKPISLERQVRIAAGLMVVIGAALGLWVYPYFGFLPLFVGAGLVFAGVTNWCGMAMLLAKAPWNR